MSLPLHPIFHITTRFATPDDLEPLRDLAIATFTGAYDKFNTPENMRHYLTNNFSKQTLLSELNSDDIKIMVGETKEEMVAYMKLVKPPTGKVAAKNPIEIARLYTRTTVIGQGIGRDMIEALEEYASEQGHDAIVLDVWQKNYRAINFYQREGFRICGLTQFRLGDDVQDDFVMIRFIPRYSHDSETSRYAD
jgi:diamine N-acetyltransferase